MFCLDFLFFRVFFCFFLFLPMLQFFVMISGLEKVLPA